VDVHVLLHHVREDASDNRFSEFRLVHGSAHDDYRHDNVYVHEQDTHVYAYEHALLSAEETYLQSSQVMK